MPRVCFLNNKIHQSIFLLNTFVLNHGQCMFSFNHHDDVGNHKLLNGATINAHKTNCKYISCHIKKNVSTTTITVNISNLKYFGVMWLTSNVFY